MVYLGLFHLAALLWLKDLPRKEETAAFRAASDAKGKLFPWKLDLFWARTPCLRVDLEFIYCRIFWVLSWFPLKNLWLLFETLCFLGLAAFALDFDILIISSKVISIFFSARAIASLVSGLVPIWYRSTKLRIDKNEESRWPMEISNGN